MKCLFFAILSLAGAVECCAQSTIADVKELVFQTGASHGVKMNSLTVTDNGEIVAISVNDQIHLVSTARGRMIHQVAGSPSTMRFSSSGERLYTIGSSRHQLFDHELNAIPIQKTEEIRGYLGLSITQGTGGIVVQNVISGGPVASQTEIKPGDRLIATAEGRSGYWQESRNVSTVNDNLKGRAGAWLRLKVIHGGSTQPTLYTIQRVPASVRGNQPEFQDLPSIEVSTRLLWCMRDGRHELDSVITGQNVASFTTIDIRSRGLTAVSPDSRKLAVLARTNDGNGHAVEVFDVSTGLRAAFIFFHGNGYYDLEFAPSGNHIYVASHQTIEVLDLVQQETVGRLHLPDDWQDPNRYIPSGHRIGAQLAVGKAGLIATAISIPVGGS